MSTAPEYGIPQFTLGDRMRLVLHDRGYSVQDAADYFEVNRNTVGNWLNGRIRPTAATVKLWSMWLRIDRAWLETGQAPTGGPDGDGLPQLDSNQQPFVLWAVQSPVLGTAEAA